MSLDSIKFAGSSMKNIQQAIDAVSHNIANVNTTAYKERKVNFESVVSSFGGTTLSGAAVNAVTPNFNQGNLKSTGRWNDMALQGQGFFTVQDAAGNMVYTRDGSFNIDSNNNLVTSSGAFVLSAGGGRITIPADATNVEVTNAGEIMIKSSGGVGFELLDQLQVTTFQNPQSLESIGGNFFRESLNSGNPEFSTALGPGSQSAETQIVSGALEASNANLSGSFTDMIAYQRSYQAVSRSATTADELLNTTLGLIR